MSSQTHHCSVCGSVEHTAPRCENRGRITKETHDECLRRWIVIMEDDEQEGDDEENNVYERVDKMIKETKRWLTSIRIFLLKSLLSLNHITSMKEAKKRILDIYKYLALKTIVYNTEPGFDYPVEIDEMIEDIEEDGEFQQYLYLIGQHYVSNGNNEEDEEVKLAPIEVKQSSFLTQVLHMEDCTICYESGSIQTQCGHSFCEPCVNNVLAKPTREGFVHCAMCRTQVTQYSCSVSEVCDRIQHIIHSI